MYKIPEPTNEEYKEIVEKLTKENERLRKALEEIAYSKEDSSCNELALKYEVIADKALCD